MKRSAPARRRDSIVRLSRLLVAMLCLAMFGESALAAEGIRWVYLEVDRKHSEDTYRSLLVREFMRQSVTIAAREHFQLGTRDAALDEPMPAEADRTLVLRPRITIERGEFKFTLEPVGRDVEPLVLTGEMESGQGGLVGGHDYMRIYLAAHYWALRDFPEYFQQFGLEADPIAVEGDAEASQEVEDLLDAFNVLAAFQAVRRTHELIREHGESRALLGQLIRGYANLGQLSRYHFNAAEQVFYARAIIYASRLMERHGESPFAHQHRAYAYVMAGMDFAAFDSMGRAHELIADAEAPDASPPWFPLLDDYLNHRHDDLERRRGRDTVALASYLRFMLAEQTGTVERILPYTRQMLEIRPYCMRVIAKIAEFPSVRSQHFATSQPQQQLAQALTFLPDVDDFPPNVEAAIGDYDATTWPDVTIDLIVDELRESAEGDQLDPSYATLGTLVDETHFAQVFRRVGFLKHMFGVPVDDFVRQAMPAIDDHRYAPLVESLRYDEAGESSTINAMLDRVEFGDLPVSAMQLLDHHPTHPDLRRWLTTRMHRSIDMTLHDSTQYVALIRGFSPAWHAGRIEYINANSPLAAALRVEYEWDEVQEDLPDLVEKFGDRASFLAGLARAYLRENREEEAEQTLLDYIDLSHEAWGYRSLVSIYRSRNDTDAWIRTVDRFLDEGESAGLDRSGMTADLAKHLVTLGRYDQAHAYADEAANSGAAWALMTASLTHELRDEWGPSERLIRQTSQRYTQGSGIYWYYWCRRTGRGDQVAARTLARQSMVQFGNEPSFNQLLMRAVFYYLEDDPERALDDISRALEEREDIWVAALAVFVAHELEDEVRRDEALSHLRREHRPAYSRYQRELVELVHTAAAAFDDPAGFDVDLDALLERAADLAPYQQVSLYQTVGFAMKALGREEEAERFLRRCAAPLTQPMISHAQTLAMAELHESGIDPYDGERPHIEPSDEPNPAAIYDEAMALLRESDHEHDEEDEHEGDGDEDAIEAEALELLQEYVDRTGHPRGVRPIGLIHMSNEDYEAALPYVERAANFASADRRHAIVVHEALGNWERAEDHARRWALATPGSRLEWFYWCVRTGRGDLGAARDVARAQVRSQPPGDGRVPLFHLLNGDEGRALLEFREAIEHDSDPWLRLHLAILLNDSGDRDEAVQLLDHLRRLNPSQFDRPDRRAMIHLARSFHGAFANPNAQPPSVQQIEGLVDDFSEDRQVGIYYFAGELYDMLGDATAADVLRRRCVTPVSVFTVNQVVAYHRMRERGIDPYDLLED